MVLKAIDAPAASAVPPRSGTLGPATALPSEVALITEVSDAATLRSLAAPVVVTVLPETYA